MINYRLYLILILFLSSFIAQKPKAPKIIEHEVNQNITPPQWPWNGVNFKCDINTNIDENEFILISKKKMNLVHILIEPSQNKNGDLSDEEIFNRLMAKTKEIIALCKKHNLTSIVSFHKFPISPSKTFNQTSKYFWNDINEINTALNFFEMGVKELASCGEELGAYEFVSEPIIRDGGSIRVPQNLREVQQRCINIIEKYDPGRYFCVSPGPGGHPKGYDDFEPYTYENTIYNFHVFGPHAYTHQGVKKYTSVFEYPGYINFQYWDTEKMNNHLENTLQWQKKYNRPMIIGSFGAVHWAKGRDTYLNDIVTFAKTNNFSYSYHCFNGYFGWSIKNNTRSNQLLKSKLKESGLKINDSISIIYEQTWKILSQTKP
jgi:endoglucanase